MTMLIAAAAAFLAIHLLISGTRARDGLTSVLGENAYMGLFALASIGVIIWMVLTYNAAQSGYRAIADGDGAAWIDPVPGVAGSGASEVAAAVAGGRPGSTTTRVPTRMRL